MAGHDTASQMAEMDASDFSDITPHSGHTMGELLGVEELAMLNVDNDDPTEAEEGRAIFPAEVRVGFPRPPPLILIQIHLEGRFPVSPRSKKGSLLERAAM